VAKNSDARFRGMKYLQDTRVVVIACCTIGLAPFVPEPHIWGKIKWIYGGAVGMQAIDWVDTALHGFPWLLLLVMGVRKVFAKKSSS
jgi:hypothetical protein